MNKSNLQLEPKNSETKTSKKNKIGKAGPSLEVRNYTLYHGFKNRYGQRTGK